MPTFSLYSNQQKALKRKTPVYRHDKLPDTLRRQIASIFDRVIGRDDILKAWPANDICTEAKKILCHEYGVYDLLPFDQKPATLLFEERFTIRRLILREKRVDRCLDVIQVMLAVTKGAIEKGVALHQPEMSFDDGIAELNERFKQHGVGFQFVDGQILRIDSEFTYQNATLPAMNILRQPFLAGANQEFLTAHEHFRHGRYKECLNECLKAFESTMKAICHKRNWPYNQNDTAKTLIKVCEDNQLFPVIMSNHIAGLRMTLESGVPTARNKTSGHGQGVTPIEVSEEFASYILNLTASNILLFGASEQKLN